MLIRFSRLHSPTTQTCGLTKCHLTNLLVNQASTKMKRKCPVSGVRLSQSFVLGCKLQDKKPSGLQFLIKRAPYTRLCQPTLTMQRMLAEASGNLSWLIHHFKGIATWKGLMSSLLKDKAMLQSHELVSWEIMKTTAAPAIQELDLVPKDQEEDKIRTTRVATSPLIAAITEKSI